MLAALGGVVALALANRLSRHPAATRPPTGETLAQEAKKTNGRFGRALASHRSLDGRLRGVADSATEHAAVLQQLHDHGLAPRGVRGNADWRPPAELSPDLPRPGPADAWQTLDRSFHALLVALDDEQASFAQHARAYQTVGDASRALADALSTAPVEQLAAGCSFCAEPRQTLPRADRRTRHLHLRRMRRPVRRDPRGATRRRLAAKTRRGERVAPATRLAMTSPRVSAR